MAGQLLQGILGKFKAGYFFFEDRYYKLLDRINNYVPIYKVVDPIDKVLPSFALLIGLVLLIAVFFVFFSLTTAVFTATLQVVDNKDNVLEGVSIELTLDGETRQILTDDWGEVQIEISQAEVEAEALLSKDGFQDIERSLTLIADETVPVTMQPTSSIIFDPDEAEKTIKVIDNSTNRLIEREVTLTFECSSGSMPPETQIGTMGEFKVVQPSNCLTLIATAEADGFERKSKTLASKVNYILLNPNTVDTTGSINVIVRDSSNSPEPDAIVRAIDEATNVEAASSSTTLSGTALLQQLQPGSYTISVTSPDGRTGQETGVSVTAGQITNVTITLPSADQADIKKIYLKLIEAGTTNAVAEAQALIYEDNILIDSTKSDSQGTVEKKLDSTGSTYLVVLTHPDYVTKIEPNVPLKELSDTTPLNVPMVRATIEQPNPTSAEIVVTVVDEASEPVKNALVSIYDSDYPEIPLKSPPGRTLEDGTYTFTNLAPGQYFAKASNEAGSAEGQSDNVTVAAGETLKIEVILVLGEGTVEAKVFDAESAEKDPIPNATVEFIDAHNPDTVLATCITDTVNGKCESEPIPADKFVNVRASAIGFVTGSAVSTVDIVNKNKAKVEIGLLFDSSVPTAGDIDVEFKQFCSNKECEGSPVSTIQSDPQGTMTYYALFWLYFLNEADYSGTIQHVRAGQDDLISLPANGYKLRITDASGAFSTHAVLSDCWNNDIFNPFTDPTDCDPGAADFKQANIYYPDLSGRQVIPFVVEFKVEPDLADGEKLEMRFKAKSTVSESEVFTVEKLLSIGVNESMCGGQNFSWGFNLVDSDGLETAIETGPGSLNEVAMNETYTLSYRIHNCSGRNLSAQVDAQNVPPEIGALSFTSLEPFDFGPTTLQPTFSFPSDTEALFDQLLFAANETDLVPLEMTLNTEITPSIQTIGFKVSASGLLEVEHVPEKLPNIGTPDLSGLVTDFLTGEAIEGAFVKLTIGESTEKTTTTDADGLFSITNIEGLQDLSTVTLEVRKAGYRTFIGLIEIGFELPPAPNPDLECITIEKDASPDVAIHFVKNITNPLTDTFMLKSDCTSPAVIHLDSVLEVTNSGGSVEDFTLNAGGTELITVYASVPANTPYFEEPIYIGEYGISIFAKFGTLATADPLLPFAGPLHTARVYVTDPGSCFRLAEPEAPSDKSAMKSTFDVTGGLSEGLIVNECFAYFEDLSLPKVEKVYGYMPVEEVFSLTYDSPTKPGESVEKQFVLDPTLDYFEEDNELEFTLVENGGYVFVDWVDFFMTDGQHDKGARHRVWAQTHKNVWSNITSQLPYTGPDKSSSLPHPIVDNYGWVDTDNIDKYTIVETTTTTYDPLPDILVQGPSTPLGQQPDVLQFAAETGLAGLEAAGQTAAEVARFLRIDRTYNYTTLTTYSLSIPKEPIWQGQHNVCGRNLGGFQDNLMESTCRIKKSSSNPAFFNGIDFVPYLIGNIASKIRLEIEGDLQTSMSAIRFHYISTDDDHEGNINFGVQNNILMGETYALIKAKDTTGVGFVATEPITVGWAYSKRGEYWQESRLAQIDQGPVTLGPREVLGISADPNAPTTFRVYDPNTSLNQIYEDLKPLFPETVDDLNGFIFKSNPDQQPTAQKIIVFYLHSGGEWTPVMGEIDLETPGETDHYTLRNPPDSGPPIPVEVLAFENDSNRSVIIDQITLSYLKKMVETAELSTGSALIQVGETEVRFSPPPESIWTGDLPARDYTSIEFLIEDTSTEAIVYFEDTLRNTTQDQTDRIVAATSTPEREANTDTEKFHIRIVGPSQDQCMGYGGLRGSTGVGSKPRVLLDWDWAAIDFDSCSADNQDYVYCDPTQFTVSLLKRLEEMRRLAEEDIAGNLLEIRGMQQFNAYLIEDAYTDDFRNDLVEFYGGQFLSNELTELGHPWGKYLADNNSRFVFETSGAVFPEDEGRGEGNPKFVAAGLHDIYIDLDFEEDQFNFFYDDPAQDMLANITVNIAKQSDPVIRNPFYYLPFNGSVGMLEDNQLDRQDYGLVFLNDNEPLAIIADIGKGAFYTTGSAEGSVGRKAVGTFRESGFDAVNILDRGMLMQVAQDFSQINFAPSIATPVLLEMIPDAGKVEAYYWLRDEEGEIAISAASFMNLWTGAGSTMKSGGVCVDYYADKLQHRVQDTVPQSGSCAANVPGSYGFTYNPAAAGEDLYFETVFYVPVDLTAFLRKSCENNSYFYAPGPTATQRTDSVSTPVSLSVETSKTKVATMQNVLNLIADEYICISTDSDYFSFWWNPQRVLQDLDGIKQDIHPGWDSELACDVSTS